FPDRRDQCSGAPRELEKARHVAVEELRDDVLRVAARTESAALAGEDDRSHFVFAIDLLERFAKLVVDLERQRVQLVGTIQREGEDAVLQLRLERFRTHHGRTAIASISTSAPGSSNPATFTRLIAG